VPEGELPIALAKLGGLCMVAGALVAGMLFPLVGGLGWASNQANDALNSVSSELVTGRLPMMTTVTDKDGAPIAYLYDQYRIPVASQDISQAMKDAVVAIEDRRFYQHGGVDWQSTVRALVRNETAGDIEQGASTITQQYVKNYLLDVVATTESERLKAIEPSYARKPKEARLAVELERQLPKQEILTRYLDIVYLGNDAYGVGAAARTYFDTTPEALTVAQAALLAGMVRSPAAHDPVTHPQAATFRRNEVIHRMQEQGMIDGQQATDALALRRAHALARDRIVGLHDCIAREDIVPPRAEPQSPPLAEELGWLRRAPVEDDERGARELAAALRDPNEKAIRAASSLVFSGLSTAPSMGTAKCASIISGTFDARIATVSSRPTPRAARADARRTQRSSNWP